MAYYKKGDMYLDEDESVGYSASLCVVLYSLGLCRICGFFLLGLDLDLRLMLSYKKITSNIVTRRTRRNL